MTSGRLSLGSHERRAKLGLPLFSTPLSDAHDTVVANGCKRSCTEERDEVRCRSVDACRPLSELAAEICDSWQSRMSSTLCLPGDFAHISNNGMLRCKQVLKYVSGLAQKHSTSTAGSMASFSQTVVLEAQPTRLACSHVPPEEVIHVHTKRFGLKCTADQRQCSKTSLKAVAT